jgi:penicillin-binding protein 1A
LQAVDTVEDMVAAYGTFANQGVYTKPQFYRESKTKVASLSMNQYLNHDVLNKDIAFAIIKLLEGVTEGGSGNRLRTDGGGYGYDRITGYPYKFTNPLQVKQEQRKPV